MTSSDTAAYILVFTFGQINPIRNVPFPSTGSVTKSQYWKTVTRKLAENEAHGTCLALSALPVDGTVLQVYAALGCLSCHQPRQLQICM